MKNNYHTHSQRCRHAYGTEEDYVKTAISKGLSELGYSDHGPFPDNRFGMRMPYEELEEYLEELERLKEQYGDRITLWKGLEIEYLSEFSGYYEKLLTEWGVEYLLMGEHFFKSEEGKLLNIYDATSTELYPVYARNVVEGIRTGFFKAVAHPDLFMVGGALWDDNCSRAADLILDAAAASGVVLEYNANGFRRGIWDFPTGSRYPYPHEGFWRMAASADVKVIVGSDCHEPHQVWDEAMELAYKKLANLSIVPVQNLILP